MHKLNSLVHPPPSYRVLATGLVLPEGSCVGPDGELYVVDAGTDTICRISDSGEVSEFVSTGGRPNGLAFGPGGDLFVADSGRRAILRVTPSGELSMFASEYDGHEFTGPNDLAFGPSGNLFFTDPGRKPPPDPSISPVYRATPDGVVCLRLPWTWHIRTAWHFLPTARSSMCRRCAPIACSHSR